jgi:hypothetical protein
MNKLLDYHFQMEKNGNNLINLNLKFITFLIGIVGIDIK